MVRTAMRFLAIRLTAPRLRLGFCFLLTACASTTQLSKKAQVAIEQRHIGRVVELRQSCFYGGLYDENEKWLLSPYAFNETYHSVDLHNQPIHPKHPKSMLPAGTRFAIIRIEFPDGKTRAMRMLTTPRDNPWVYLQGVSTEGTPVRKDKPFIIILPLGLDTEQQFETALNQLLGPEGSVIAWMEARKPTIRAAIETKTAVPGMSPEELFAALGNPLHLFNDNLDGLVTRVAWYPSQEIWLVGGKVTAVKPARVLPEMTAPEKKS
jgi:hypothetical protein